MISHHQRYTHSISLWERAKQSIVPGSSTISKRADLYPLGGFPIYLEKAQGAEVYDVDGNHYIDFQSALGAVILGSNHAHINQAIQLQMQQGFLFSLSHPSLIQLAEKLTQLIPSAERVRILKNGSDATSGAVRIARAYTGRDMILTCHYHSWHDWYYVSTSMNAGIPKPLAKHIVNFPYGDIAALKSLFHQYPGKIAGIIMEPTHLTAPAAGYLKAVQALAHESGSVLIFDEVVTGFRFGLGGAQTYFDVVPDISCFAKALGNGSPIAALVGKKEIMDATQQVVTTQTYAEDCLAIAAAIATLEILENEPVVDHIWKLGQYFQDNYQALAKKYHIDTKCVGYPIRMQIEFVARDNLTSQFLKSYFLQETAKDGYLIAHMIFMNYAHTKNQVNGLLNSIEKIFDRIANKPSSTITLDGNMAIDIW